MNTVTHGTWSLRRYVPHGTCCSRDYAGTHGTSGLYPTGHLCYPRELHVSHGMFPTGLVVHGIKCVPTVPVVCTPRDILVTHGSYMSPTVLDMSPTGLGLPSWDPRHQCQVPWVTVSYPRDIIVSHGTWHCHPRDLVSLHGSCICTHGTRCSPRYLMFPTGSILGTVGDRSPRDLGTVGDIVVLPTVRLPRDF